MTNLFLVAYEAGTAGYKDAKPQKLAIQNFILGCFLEIFTGRSRMGAILSLFSASRSFGSSEKWEGAHLYGYFKRRIKSYLIPPIILFTVPGITGDRAQNEVILRLVFGSCERNRIMVLATSPGEKTFGFKALSAFLVFSYFFCFVTPLHQLRAQDTLRYVNPQGEEVVTVGWDDKTTTTDDFFRVFSFINDKVVSDFPDLTLSDESAALVYARAQQKIAAQFAKRFEGGTLAVGLGVFKDSDKNYLPQLKELFERNGRQKIVVEVPEHAVLGEMIPAINEDLRRAGWGEFVEYKVNDQLGRVGLENVFPGEQAKSQAKWNSTRSLLVPVISVAGAYLGVMAQHVFNNPHFQALQSGLINIGQAGEKVTEIEAAMRLGPVFVGTVASVLAALGVRQLSLGAQQALSQGKAGFFNKALAPVGKYVNQHTVIGLAGAATLAGTATLIGPSVVATMIQVGMLMAAGYGLEYQFSKYSSFWDKYFWRVGWVDFLHSKKLMPRKVFDGLKAAPKVTGFMTNWGVNTAYPFMLLVSLAAGSALAEAVTHSVSALGGPYLGDPFAYGNVVKGALKNGFFFSSAFGLLQVLIGSLKEKGVITEALRFKIETAAVTYNQTGRVFQAAGADLGRNMQIAFALAVTLPTFVFTFAQSRIRAFIDSRSNERFQRAIRCEVAFAKLAH